jgi:hypothetical protein
VGQRLHRRDRATCAQRLLDIVHGHDTHVVVPLQGSGTFSVEAAVATVVPRDGHVLVPDNGAYCKRAAKLSQMMGRRATVMAVCRRTQPVSAAARGGASGRTRSITPRRADPLRDRHRRGEPAGRRWPRCASAAAWA